MKEKMRELIMLIDIYEEEVVWVHSVWCIITDKEAARIISKQFWLIKRLVENDKIDYSKLVEYEFDKLERFIQRKYNALLMLLSIQDEPVKFLSDILK